MVKHTRTIRECLSGFNHFVWLALNRLRYIKLDFLRLNLLVAVNLFCLKRAALGWLYTATKYFLFPPDFIIIKSGTKLCANMQLCLANLDWLNASKLCNWSQLFPIVSWKILSQLHKLRHKKFKELHVSFMETSSLILLAKCWWEKLELYCCFPCIKLNDVALEISYISLITKKTGTFEPRNSYIQCRNFPANIYLFKVNNRNTTKRCKTCSNNENTGVTSMTY